MAALTARDILGFVPDRGDPTAGARAFMQGLSGFREGYRDAEARRRNLALEAQAKAELEETKRSNLVSEGFDGRDVATRESTEKRQVFGLGAETEAGAAAAEQSGEHERALRMLQEYERMFPGKPPPPELQAAAQAPAPQAPQTTPESLQRTVDSELESAGFGADEAARLAADEQRFVSKVEGRPAPPPVGRDEWLASRSGANRTAPAVGVFAEQPAASPMPQGPIAQIRPTPQATPPAPQAAPGGAAPLSLSPAVQMAAGPSGRDLTAGRTGYDDYQERAGQNVAKAFAESKDPQIRALAPMAPGMVRAMNGDEQKATEALLGLLKDERYTEAMGRRRGGSGIADDKKFLDATRMIAKDLNQLHGTKMLIDMEAGADRATTMFSSPNSASQRIAFGSLIRSLEQRATNQDRDFYLGAQGLWGLLRTKANFLLSDGALPEEYMQAMADANDTIQQLVSRKRTEIAQKAREVMMQTPFFYKNLAPDEMDQYADMAVRLVGARVAEPKGRESGEPKLVGSDGDAEADDILEGI